MKLKNSVGCTIEDENISEKDLKAFLKAGWKIVKDGD